MAVRDVDVNVYAGEQVVTILSSRPVRLTPTGHAGVVHAGKVYPLHRGNFIRLEDQPLDKHLCLGFVTAGSPIPYVDDGLPAVSYLQHLGIGDWYLESNRFGHYLVFDGSQAAAHRLVEAVEDAGLGVQRFDESSRPADNGEFYDWFIRLGFDGSREQCMQQVVALMSGAHDEDGDSWDDVDDQPAADGPSGDLREMAERIRDASGTHHDLDWLVYLLEVFEPAAHTERGYLAWRLRELGTRPGNAIDSSVDSRLQAMSSIVKADKEIIARLVARYGAFLEDRPHLAKRAMRAEFNEVDPDGNFEFPDGWELERRARDGLTFLRRAAILTFGSEDSDEWMPNLLPRLSPPETVTPQKLWPHAGAANSNLRRMITCIEELFSGDSAQLAGLYERGRAELMALHSGEFDFLADLPMELSSASEGLSAGDLPFVVLPPGELLQSFLGELRSTGSYLGGTVDLERVRVLERLGRYFGDHGRRCTVHRGAFSAGGKDNGYVVLRLARQDGDHEDAVAISPWKGEHATYVVRHGCGAKRPWPFVLSKTKREAKQLGARRLLFQSKREHRIDVYEAMYQKVSALLECQADEFDNGELYFDYRDRCYQVREADEYDPRNGDGFEDAPPSSADRQASAPKLLHRIRNLFGRP